MKKASRVIAKTFAKENRDLTVVKIELALFAVAALWPVVRSTY